MVAVVPYASYCSRHIIRFMLSFYMVPKNVSLHLKKVKADKLMPYMVTFKMIFLYPESVIFSYIIGFKNCIHICEISILHILTYDVSFIINIFLIV